MNESTIAVLVAAISALGMRDVVQSVLNRRRNKITDNNLETAAILSDAAAVTAAKKVAAETISIEVETARDLLKEVNIYRQELGVQIAALKIQLNLVTERLSKVEERERHMLARAATHEAWDQMSFAMLVRMDPLHPPPPPLISHKELEELEDADALEKSTD